ncbi:MAG: PKD domain-containing protein [Thermoplasmata archaeon]|nr:PKD domain-containing protein [Thermoplasmata archaeon]
MRSALGRSLRARPWIGLVPIAATLVGILLLVGLPAPGAPSAPRAAGPSLHASAVQPFLPTNATGEGWYHPKLTGPAPSPRDGASAAYDAKDGYLVLFGGCAKPLCPLFDTWKFQAGGWANLTSSVGIPPTGRSAAAMAYDARDGYVVLFGGTGSAGVLGDTWTFQYGRWTQVATTPATAPSPRTGMGLVYDPVDSRVILYGGAGATGAPLSDTWSFAGGVWTNLTPTIGAAPPARFSAGFAFDSIDHTAILFGGSGVCGVSCADTWSYVGSHWSNLTASVGTNVPSARSAATLAFDDGRGVTVLIGGQNGAPLSDTWAYAHGVWTYLSANTSSSLGARASVAAAFDPTDGYLVAYGGHSATALKSGTWLLLTPLSGIVVPSLTVVTPGVADQFVATVSGGYGIRNVTWNFGDGTAIVIGPSTGHTYFATGSFPVTITVTDGLGVTVSAAVTITVQLPPFTVAISASPGSPVVGQTVTLLATPSGGTGPYVFQWSGDVGTCAGATAATLTCTAAAPRTLQLAITVTDTAHRSASGSAAITFAAASTGVTGSSPTTSVGSGGSGLSPTFTSIYLAFAIFAACAVGVFTYRAGRRREAARKAELRPLCYAVPAWSETPADFGAAAPAPADAPADDPDL